MTRSKQLAASSDEYDTYEQHLSVAQEVYADLNGVEYPFEHTSEVESAEAVRLNELFPSGFIAQNSEYSTLGEVISASSLRLDGRTDEDILFKVPKVALDSAVSTETDFDSADKLICAAIDYHIAQGGD
jgi:hypothetical protein